MPESRSSPTSSPSGQRSYAWVTFALVLVAQGWLVGRIGTDIPFYDQWSVEGRWLYPSLAQGSFPVSVLFRTANEHRIVWTQLLNAALFEVNGQWDPLVQMAAIGLLRAGCAAGVTVLAGALAHGARRIVLAVAVAIAFLPFLAWHPVLWGFESQIYFAIGFSLAAIGLLSAPDRPPRHTLLGLLAGVSGLFAMQPTALVGPSLLGLECLRALASRGSFRAFLRDALPALGLLAAALLLWPRGTSDPALHPGSLSEFLRQCAHVLAWPFPSPWASVATLAPLALLALRAVARGRGIDAVEGRVLTVGLWGLATGLATAWARGGSPELVAGVPSRYVDFLILIPISGAGSLALLLKDLPSQRRLSAYTLAVGWGAALLIGWSGLTVQTWHGVIGPRLRAPDAPVRLFQAYQRARDPSVFAHAPRLYVPAPDLGPVNEVLSDPSLSGRLPPSLQPSLPQGPLSHGLRTLLLPRSNARLKQ